MGSEFIMPKAATQPPTDLTQVEAEAVITFLTGLRDQQVAYDLEEAARQTKGFEPLKTVADVLAIIDKCDLQDLVVTNPEDVVRQLHDKCLRLAQLCVKPEDDDSDDFRRRLVPNRFLLERAFEKLQP